MNAREALHLAVRANGRGVTVTFHCHAPPTVEHCEPGSGPVPTRRDRGVDFTPQART